MLGEKIFFLLYLVLREPGGFRFSQQTRIEPSLHEALKNA